MTTPPAVVTIQDLPTGTTVTGTELLEVVQTSGGVAQSVQLALSNIFGTTLGALPSGGGTGQLLKSQGSGLLASWVNAASVVTASTGLAESGSTTIALSLASTVGLSVLAVAATGSAVPTAIAGTGAQTLRVNDTGTVLGFGALNLGSSAAVTGVLPGANYSAVNLAIGGAGGVQGVLPGANMSATNLAASGVGGVQGVLATSNMTAINLASSGGGGVSGILPAANVTAINVATTGAGGIQGQPFFLPTTNLTSGGATTMGIHISSASNFGIFCGTGVPTLTAGTGSLYLNGAPTNAATRLYVNTNGLTAWVNFTASA